jgi:sulfur-oxidizing protein SoxZ
MVIEYSAGSAQLRAMFSHPMETGRRRDANGALIAADYITEVVCEYRGREVLKADWSTGIAKNPALTIELDGVRRGERVRLRWRDNHGREASAEAVIR